MFKVVCDYAVVDRLAEEVSYYPWESVSVGSIHEAQNLKELLQKDLADTRAINSLNPSDYPGNGYLIDLLDLQTTPFRIEEV